MDKKIATSRTACTLGQPAGQGSSKCSERPLVTPFRSKNQARIVSIASSRPRLAAEKSALTPLGTTIAFSRRHDEDKLQGYHASMANGFCSVRMRDWKRVWIKACSSKLR